MVYIITYDLNKSGQNYQALYSAIKKQGSAINALQNLWLLDSKNSAIQIYPHLKGVIDSNDHIFIAQMNSNRWGYLPQNVWGWLENRL